MNAFLVACSSGHDYEHDLLISSKYDMLGSVDCNSGDPLVGWDTDQFAMDIKKTTLAMKIVLEQGGLEPGGLNFDAKVPPLFLRAKAHLLSGTFVPSQSRRRR